MRLPCRGDELTAVMPYHEKLVGNPMLPALHGGATAAFLEVAAVIELGWTGLWKSVETGTLTPEAIAQGDLIKIPKTIDFSVDYLRLGLPRDAYARACQPLGAALCIGVCRGMARQPKPDFCTSYRTFSDAGQRR